MPSATYRPIDHLTDALVSALRRLGEAGQPEAASRIAAKAYVAVRHDEPRAAARINGVMHFLARLEATAADPDSTEATGTPPG